MNKKFLSLSAAAFFFTACASTEKQNEAVVEPAIQTAETATTNSATTADSVTVQQQYRSIELPSDTVQYDSSFTSCKIFQMKEDLVQMGVSIPDSAQMTITIYEENGNIYANTALVLDEKVSDEVIARECESAKKKAPNGTAICDGRNVSGTMFLGPSENEILYPFLAAELYRNCVKISETSSFEFFGKKVENSSANSVTVQNAPEIQCNMDMSSDLWTIKEKDVTTTIQFTEEAIFTTKERLADLALPDLCKIASERANRQKELFDGSRCEGSILILNKKEKLPVIPKNIFYDKLKENCPSK